MIAILLVAAASATSNKFRTDEKQLHMLGTLKDLVKLERAEDTLVFGHFGRGESEAAARANFEAVARSFNPGFDKGIAFGLSTTPYLLAEARRTRSALGRLLPSGDDDAGGDPTPMILALRGWNSAGKRLAHGRMRLTTFAGNASSFHALRRFVFAACIPSIVRVPSLWSGRAGQKEKARADIALFSSVVPKLYFFYDPVRSKIPPALIDVAQRFATPAARRIMTFAVAVDPNDADPRSPSKHLLYHVARVRTLRSDRKPIVIVSNLYHQGAMVFDWAGFSALAQCADDDDDAVDAVDAACAGSTEEERRDALPVADALAHFIDEFLTLRGEGGAEAEPMAQQFSEDGRRRRKEKLAHAHNSAHGHHGHHGGEEDGHAPAEDDGGAEGEGHAEEDHGHGHDRGDAEL